MPNTYTLLETITVGAAGASSVTFNSIPQTGYTDLVIKVSARSTTSNLDYLLRFNGSTTTYSDRWLYGTGSSVASISNSSIYIEGNRGTWTANTFSNTEIYVPNYLSSNFKSVSIDTVTENNATDANAFLIAGLWSTTTAISSVTILPASGNIAQHSTFSLYGVSALGVTPTKAPKATGGSIIQTDGTYWYHAFLSSGTFTPATALSCDVLVVAGGGGGTYPGAGGAGGILAFASQSTSTAKTVTIGAGGAEGYTTRGSNGGNSTFGSLTSAIGGGGGGAQPNQTTGADGGSGGGGTFPDSGTGYIAGGAGTSGQGNTGGSGQRLGGGGGGGGGAVGQNANAGGTNYGGAGGIGLNTVTNWGALSTALTTLGLGASGYLAGGGGGASWAAINAAGGTGGGGNGGASAGQTGFTAGTATAGGGGGGAVNGGQPGGSGLVIVRYLA